MMHEILPAADLKIYQEIDMPDGGRIVLANPAFGWIDKSVDAANHNVFRIDPAGRVVWQVRREEAGFVNWASRNQHAKEADPACDGYRDEFASMGTQFFIRHPTNDPRPFQPKFRYELFDSYAPGRILGLSTYEFEYDLDPASGIATCTGMPVK